MSKRVLIVVTHLLGAGHLTRATALARAFAAAGHAVTLVSGGMPTSLSRAGQRHVRPACRRCGFAGPIFRKLLDEQGTPITAKVAEARGAILHETIGRAQPDVLITELFPFGRRVLAEEFLAVLHQAHAMRATAPRPLVDPRHPRRAAKPSEIAEAAARLDEFYDARSRAWRPRSGAARCCRGRSTTAPAAHPLHRLCGRGRAAAPAAGERGGILVSGGSSAASLPLYRAALEAARAGRPTEPGASSSGAASPTTASTRCAERRRPMSTVERARPDFRALLAAAAVSVSQAGYNTMRRSSALRVRAPCWCPSRPGSETEQRLRAERLQRTASPRSCPKTRLAPATPCRGFTVALRAKQPLPPRSSVDSNGAQERPYRRGWRAARPGVRPPRRLARARRALAEPRQCRSRARPVVARRRRRDARRPALNRLLRLAARFERRDRPRGRPGPCRTGLAERLLAESRAPILVHGYSPPEPRPAGEKKAEFGPGRDIAVMAAEAGRGLAGSASRYFATGCLPVFVPPWNRIAPELVAAASGCGLYGPSTLARPPRRPARPGLRQINTHIDPIDWRGGREPRRYPDIDGCPGDAIAAARRRCCTDPIGLLTHHLVHDEAIWRVLRRVSGLFGAQEFSNSSWFKSYSVTIPETSSSRSALSFYNAPSVGEAYG